MQKPNAYLWDLDGTLCDVNHRRKFVSTNPKNWDAWNAGLVNDTPNEPVCQMLKLVSNMHHLINEYDTSVIIVSGRSEDYKAQTDKWLSDREIFYDEIYMSKSGDWRDDAIIKSEFADQIEEKYNIVAVFDDRPRVIKSWQSRGIFTFDVSQGCADF